MDTHLLNKRFKEKEIRFRTSIGEDGMPENLTCGKEVQHVLD
jgi:hypothetical protein